VKYMVLLYVTVRAIGIGALALEFSRGRKQRGHGVGQFGSVSHYSGVPEK